MVPGYTDVAGDPVIGESFVAVFHVRLNIFVQCEIVTMWISDVFNGTLAVRVDDDVCCWLGLGVADCFVPLEALKDFVAWGATVLQKHNHMCHLHLPNRQ